MKLCKETLLSQLPLHFVIEVPLHMRMCVHTHTHTNTHTRTHTRAHTHAHQNARAGHYYAYVRDSTQNTWYCANDSYVQPASVEEVLNEQAYM